VTINGLLGVASLKISCMNTGSVVEALMVELNTKKNFKETAAAEKP
jgi:hypothetical protein